MFDFEEIMRRAQNGEVAENMAKAFDLSRQQAESAMEAMLPAFAEGIKRNTENMEAMAGLFDQLSSGGHTDYFQNAANAFGMNAVGDGNNILGQIFGSKDVSRAVAEQTAAFAGIGSDIARKMLPMMASILAGGMEQQARQNNPFEAMMKQFGMGGSDNPLANMAGDFMKQFGGGNSAASDAGANFMEESKKAAESFGGLFQEMFQTGQKVQSAQAEAMEKIFDQFNKKAD